MSTELATRPEAGAPHHEAARPVEAQGGALVLGEAGAQGEAAPEVIAVQLVVAIGAQRRPGRGLELDDEAARPVIAQRCPAC